MSHFSVLIIGDNIEEQLAPFQENNMGDCDSRFLKFFDTEEEYRKEYKIGSTEMVQLRNGDLKSPWDECFRVNNNSVGLGGDTHKVPKGLKKVKIKHKDRYETLEKFVSDWHGTNARDVKMKRYGYWENPNSKWDWYVIGGRWGGFFLPKTGKTGRMGDMSTFDKLDGDQRDHSMVDQIRKGDIDFEGTLKKFMAEREKNWGKWEEKDKAREDRMWLYGISPGQTKEQYTADVDLCTFAVVKDGKWYERGKMGWWGTVGNKKKDEVWKKEFMKLLKSIPDDTLLTVVDCHI